MTPAQLDLITNGLFVYQGKDGPFVSDSYKLRDYGVTLLRRTGPLTEEDLAGTVDAAVERYTAKLGTAA